jgi:NAD(P)H-hydrate epimerase
MHPVRTPEPSALASPQSVLGHALLTPMEMAAADRASIAAGVSGICLMEAAGCAVFDAVRARWPVQPVVVLCGPGNNGGDGFVAARCLARAGWPVRLALLGDRVALQGDAAHHAALWDGPVAPALPAVLGDAGLVIDALFGAGLSRPLDGAAAQLIEAVAARPLGRPMAVCAVDVPSGLDGATGLAAGPVLRADLTVTFFRKKPGHVLLPGRVLCGETVVAGIGMPDAVAAGLMPGAFENAPALWRDAYPWPRIDGHKYQRGHALVLGGPVLTGASRLTAQAAQRVGAGLVTLAAPVAAWPIYAAALAGVIVLPLQEPADFQRLLGDARLNAIAIGPGAGVGESTRQAVLAALATRRAVVLDADALSAFADTPSTLFDAIQGPCVLTPHEGEFARLFGAASGGVIGTGSGSDKLSRARRAAEVSGAVVLLKGPDTVIAEPSGRAVINTHAPPELATGGSGDVLTGLICGLLAQGMTAPAAAAAAAWLHGDVAHAFGPGLIADDLPHGLPAALGRLKAM